jgi:hypothetical protein
MEKNREGDGESEQVNFLLFHVKIFVRALTISILNT